MRSNVYIFICFALCVIGCKRDSTEEETNGGNDSTSIVKITAAQSQSLNLRLGVPQRSVLLREITVSGKLDVPPQNLVTIAAPMGGFVKHTDMLEGMKVRKGDVLVTLSNPDYIQLQQDYLDSKSKLEFLEAEYRRQQSLAKDSINSGKSLQQAVSNFNSMKAIVAGYAAKLSLLQIDPDKVSADKITTTISLRAPMNGYITSVNINIGQYVNSSDVMMKMVNTEHLHAELYVFEKDAGTLSIGQPVKVKLAGDTSAWEAEVYLIGKEIMSDRTIRVHCHFKDEHEELIPGMFVTARIGTRTDSTNVIPTDAVVNFDGQKFVFVEQSPNTYAMTLIKTGSENNGFVGIDSIGNLSGRIVFNGSHALLGLLKNTEEE